MCANFQSKWTTLNPSAKIYPKLDLGLEIQKTNVGIRISILRIPYVCEFSGKTNNFDFFYPNLPKNGFRAGNLEN